MTAPDKEAMGAILDAMSEVKRLAIFARDKAFFTYHSDNDGGWYSSEFKAEFKALEQAVSEVREILDGQATEGEAA